MVSIHPQYINDANGNKSLVVLTAKEFDSLMEELEELEDIKLYDQSKADNELPLSAKEAKALIEAERKKRHL